MTKRTLILIVVGLLVVGGATAAIASSLGGSDSEPVHTLEGGRTHTGEMPPDQHQMDDGTMMDGGEMEDMQGK